MLSVMLVGFDEDDSRIDDTWWFLRQGGTWHSQIRIWLEAWARVQLLVLDSQQNVIGQVCQILSPKKYSLARDGGKQNNS